MQRAMYDYRRFISALPVMVPNIYLWSWESDLLYLSKANYATEFEIKRSRSDYRADAKKTHKHLRLSTNGVGPTEFYYVCPPHVISIDDLPDYAGLLHIVWVEKAYYYDDRRPPFFMAKMIKRAKRRNVGPLKAHQIKELLQKGVHRYWSLQLHLDNRGSGV